MNDNVQRITNCAARAHYFGKKPELAPLSAKETALFTAVETAWTGLKGREVDFGTGNRGFREGGTERRLLVREMMAMNRRISDIAKSIALEGVDPGMAEKFRLPKTRTFQVVAATAEGFATTAEPVKALFIERGMDATFVEDVKALVTAYEAANGARLNGLALQTTGTAGLKQLAKEALKFVRLLRPVISEKLKNQPALQTAWKLAARVAARGTIEPPVVPPPPPSGS